MATSKLTSAWKAYRPLAFRIFTLTVFVTHVWAFVNIFYDVPSWLLYLSAWDLIGVVAYNLLYAFAETLLVSLLLILPGFIFSKQWRTENYLSICGSLLLLTGVFALALHKEPSLWNWKRPLAVLWGIGNAALFAIFLRVETLRDALRKSADRVSLLIYLYLAVDLIALLIILARNL